MAAKKQTKPAVKKAGKQAAAQPDVGAKADTPQAGTATEDAAGGAADTGLTQQGGDAEHGAAAAGGGNDADAAAGAHQAVETAALPVAAVAAAGAAAPAVDTAAEAALLALPRTARTDDGKRPYTVLSPLDHDQDRYAVDDEVHLTDKQAAPLLGHTVKPA